MANTIRHKRSATAGATPNASALVPGELAINTADGRLFTETNAGAVVEFARRDLVVRTVNGLSPDANGDVSTSSTPGTVAKASRFFFGQV